MRLRIIFFTLVILLFSQFVKSQENYNTSNLVANLEDLRNNTYSKDSTANAFYIYEKGYSRVQNGGNYNLLTDYEAKIKLLNEQGYEQATVEIKLFKKNNSKERIRDITAITHTLKDGNIIKRKVKESEIFRQEINENWTLVKFTFPNLEPGAVITYSYQKESPFIYNFKGWDFQTTIPKLYSQYTTDLPANYEYNIRLTGTLDLETNESTIKRNCIEVSRGGHSDCSHNVYVMKNIPAFAEEKYMTDKKNYLSRIAYDLKEFKGFDGTKKKYTKTWKNVDNEIKNHINIGQQLKKIKLTADLLPTSIASLPHGLDKAKKIYHWVHQNYIWNGNYEIFRTSDQAKVKKVIEQKTGNVSGINILLHNILKQQQFNVQCVLASTRQNGYPTKLFPILYDFNYSFVQLSLNNKKYQLDATNRYLAFGQLPYRCLNQYARLLDFKSGSSWVDIIDNQRSVVYFKEKNTLKKNLEIESQHTHQFGGYVSLKVREIIDHKDPKNYLDDIITFDTEPDFENLKITNRDDPEKPLEASFSFTLDAEKIEDLIYIKPFNIPFYKENPFKLQSRTYPVDFGYKPKFIYSSEIEIPEGYDFIEIPKDLNYKLPNNLGKTSLSFKKNEKKITVTHFIQFNSTYYPVEYYDYLKEFINLIIKMENDNFILVKKIS